MKITNKIFIIGALIIFLIIRVFVALEYGQKESEFQDAKSYNNYANVITDNSNWLKTSDFYGDYREPVYPLFLAFIYYLFGKSNYIVVYIIQAIISTISVYLIYLLTKNLTNNDKKAVIFSFIWAGIDYFYLKYVGQLIRETLEVFFVILLLYIFFLFNKRKGRTILWLLLLSILFLILTHLNGKYLFFIPFIFVYFVNREKFIKGLLNYSLFIIFFILFATPWLLRNYSVYHKIVIVNTRTFQIDLKHGKYRSEKNTVTNAAGFGKITELNNEDGLSRWEKVEILKGNNPLNRSDKFVKAILRGKKPAEGYWGRRWFMFKQFWRITNFRGDFFPMPSGRFTIWSWRHNMLNIVFLGILLILATIAIIKLFMENNIQVLLYTLYPLLLTTVLHTFIWSRERYRLPFEAFLIILGGIGFSFVYSIIIKYFTRVTE